MAMISSMTSLSSPPSGIFGMKKSRAICPMGGWTMTKIGTSSRLPPTSANEKRSKRRKLPVPAATMMSIAAAATPQNLDTPR
jgi:hypothetical protein